MARSTSNTMRRWGTNRNRFCWLGDRDTIRDTPCLMRSLSLSLAAAVPAAHPHAHPHAHAHSLRNRNRNRNGVGGGFGAGSWQYKQEQLASILPQKRNGRRRASKGASFASARDENNSSENENDNDNDKVRQGKVNAPAPAPTTPMTMTAMTTTLTPDWAPAPTSSFVTAGSILQTLHLCGFQAFIVGGWVRDMCLGRIPTSSASASARASALITREKEEGDHEEDVDIDIATDATAEQVKELFRRSHYTDNRTDTVIVVPTLTPSPTTETESEKTGGASASSRDEQEKSSKKKSKKKKKKQQQQSKINTAAGAAAGTSPTFPFSSSHSSAPKPLEVSTFRGEDKHCARSDAMLRDFTVNALFYNVCTGEVVDHVGGLRDMRRKVLRAVGRAEDRFHEDPCRIMRAVRLAAVLEGFEIEEETYRVMRSHSRLLEQVAPERLILEVVKCGQGSPGVWAKSLHILQDSGLHKYAFPEIDAKSFAKAAQVAGNVNAFLQEHQHQHQEGNHNLNLGRKGKEVFFTQPHEERRQMDREEEEKEKENVGKSTMLSSSDAAAAVTGVRLASLLDPSLCGEEDYKALALRSGVLRSHKKGIIAMSLLQKLEAAWTTEWCSGGVSVRRVGGDALPIKGTMSRKGKRETPTGGSPSLISLMLDFYSYPSDLVDYCLLMYSQRLEPREVAGLAFLRKHRDQRLSMSTSIGMRRSKTRPVSSKALEKAGIRPGPKMGDLLQLAEELAVVNGVFEEKQLLQLLKESSLWPASTTGDSA